MALESTQPLREMSTTRNLPGCKGPPARKAGKLAAISEPNVQKMWKPRCLTTLRASTVCYRDSFTVTLSLFTARFIGMNERVRKKFALFRSSPQYKHFTEINRVTPHKTNTRTGRYTYATGVNLMNFLQRRDNNDRSWVHRLRRIL
jgi:hypothetical protein